MKRVPLYSSSDRAKTPGAARPSDSGFPKKPLADARVGSGAKNLNRTVSAEGSVRRRLRFFYSRRERPILVFSGLVFALTAVFAYSLLTPKQRVFTQKDIDAAVQYTMENLPPEPSPASVAYAIIRPSVVRVRQLGAASGDKTEIGVGTGVVIVDSGLILTALHVVAGAERIEVVFYDGSESDAAVVSVQEDQDLAVLQAFDLPDDLKPATLRSTAGLKAGDEVIAVGHPFGIGPSVSSGVISGLGRTFFSVEGKRELSDLIQFDAAVNPGNSGGPLVADDGSVIGIVVSLYNPTEQRTFIGIGFAVPMETAAGGIGIPPF